MIVIGIGVGCGVGALLVGIIAAFCVRRKLKSGTTAVDDINPVYGDYSDVYISTEVTDRNTSYHTRQRTWRDPRR